MRQEGGIDLGAVLRGLGSGAVVAAVAVVLATGMLYATQQPVGLVPISASGIAWLSVLAAGLFAARSAGHAGALHGALAGIAVFVCLLVAGTLAFDLPLSMQAAGLRMVGAALAGGLGGSLGLLL